MNRILQRNVYLCRVCLLNANRNRSSITVTNSLTCFLNGQIRCASNNKIPARRLYSNWNSFSKKVTPATGKSWLLVNNHERRSYHASSSEDTSPQARQQQSNEDVIKFNSDDFKFIENDIKKELETSTLELKEISQYHFDGAGKYIRPMISILMSQACNRDHSRINSSQREVATIVEMIHTASLVHDDVIDASNLRRGKETAHHLWGQKKAILAGNYILSTASRKLARIGNVEVVQVLSQVLEDLVKGEFMQLGSKESDTERFNHYMKKTYKKTASLIANSCKAVAILADGDVDNMRDIAYQYGRNVGIAFQLIDDYLDFVANESSMGKPVCADLQLGLATAPVLYASMQFPELNSMIMRRFSRDGDVQEARRLVMLSNGVEYTKFLAKQHCQQAIECVEKLENSAAKRSLIDVTEKILKRTK
ncbi:hypothetical protein HELRODRAFT_185542 [Helobdella robusta]|uniref:All trans-polyprenyl-diphosphate synthase PDSS1 n=1 Tax=Helobdella robusta TaxID=6412 RepID=T1FMY5_HELRO|nr:hypothetical protein HELRODRAFT_185542 [Helobdella robusta]ESO05002.1 hypothetical protein HELRODRAFT_185542 [Helobdella robusta]